MDITPGSHPGDADSVPGEEVAPEGIGDADDGDTEGDADDGDTEGDADDGDPHDPLRFSNWMKRSATGAVLSGIALGLQHALEEKRQLPAFVMEAPGEPEDPDAMITLHFDPDDPTNTVAVIRQPPSTGPEGPTAAD
ncbi:MAG: hypothetical protein ABSF84_11505 [Acidimicrobiales bacterium]